MKLQPLLMLLSSLILHGCAISRPCSIAGDLSWNPAFSEKMGNKTCHQKQLKDGKWVNHGEYILYYHNGKKALTGQFAEGRKDGYWYGYSPTGDKNAERYFENGVEKVPPLKKAAELSQTTSP